MSRAVRPPGTGKIPQRLCDLLTIEDDAIKEDIREVRRLIADLVQATVKKVGDEVRDAVKRH